METVTAFDTILLADHLVLIVFALALAMQWLLHGMTARLSIGHLALTAGVAIAFWALAGWLIGGVSGLITFALGVAASLAMALVDERARKARGEEGRGGIRYG